MNHHDGAPVFLHRPPDHPAPGHARYVTALGSAVAQAQRTPPGITTSWCTAGRLLSHSLRAGLVRELTSTNTVRLDADIAEGDIVAYLLGSTRSTFAPVPFPGWGRGHG